MQPGRDSGESLAGEWLDCRPRAARLDARPRRPGGRWPARARIIGRNSYTATVVES